MKEELRRAMRRELKGFDGEGRLKPEIVAAGLPGAPATLLAFLSHGAEIETAPLISEAFERGIVVAAPRVVGTELHFHRLDSPSGPFVRGAFGIREPPADAPRLFPSGTGGSPVFPVLVLVPGLAFSRSGDRLGRGGGFYDRFIAAFLATYPERRKEIFLAGICHTFQIVPSVPVEAHDIPVDCIITEMGCIVCGRR